MTQYRRMVPIKPSKGGAYQTHAVIPGDRWTPRSFCGRDLRGWIESGRRAAVTCVTCQERIERLEAAR
jgi:hypothetical protein